MALVWCQLLTAINNGEKKQRGRDDKKSALLGLITMADTTSLSDSREMHCCLQWHYQVMNMIHPLRMKEQRGQRGQGE